MRRRRAAKSEFSPFQEQYEPPLEGGGDEEGDESSSSGFGGAGDDDEYDEVEEDDLPLGTIASRRLRKANLPRRLGPLHPLPSTINEANNSAVRIRRGSEGFEVRPLGLGKDLDPNLEEDIDSGSGSGSEGEVDEDGDRIRKGPRYVRYVPEKGSEEEDSMDEYLNDAD